MTDPVRELSHDHSELNRRVLELGGEIGGSAPRAPAALAGVLEELREHLFLHFAREEEGLFPFVAEAVPELAEQVAAMAVAHDAVCGALARMVYLARAALPPPRAAPGGPAAPGAPAAPTDDAGQLRTLFERFESAYIEHARAEAAVLAVLDQRLDAAQRARLAELVRDL
jgi:hypothetical protein